MLGLRFNRAAAAFLLLLVAASTLAAGCGGPSAAQVARTRQIEAERLARAVRKEEQRLTRRAQAAAHAACETRIGPFLKALNELDSRLGVGLTFSNYTSRVGDVRVAYDRIGSPADLSGACLRAAAAGETAMNDYISANDTWNNCISDIYCNTDSIDPQLQVNWSKATDKVAEAQQEADEAGLDAGPDQTWTNEVPTSAAGVNQTVYGRAARELCGDSAPAAAVAPCTDLRTVLRNGVSAQELHDLDKAVKALNLALGLEPASGG